MIQVIRYTGPILVLPEQLVKIIKLINEDRNKSTIVSMESIVMMSDEFARAFIRSRRQLKKNIRIKYASEDILNIYNKYINWPPEKIFKPFFPHEKIRTEMTVKTIKEPVSNILEHVLDKRKPSHNTGWLLSRRDIEYNRSLEHEKYPEVVTVKEGDITSEDIEHVIVLLYNNHYEVQEIEDRLHIGIKRIQAVLEKNK